MAKPIIKVVKLIIIAALIYSYFPITAHAGVFDPPVTDLSVEYLGKIFGGSVGGINLGTTSVSNPFLGNLFQVFNGVVLAIAALILSYVGTLSIINTAHQGEIMGKKWSSVWIPLRSAGGLLLLAPVPGSGYSLLQVTVMWIIINGIGAADKIWNFTVDNLAQGITVSQTTKLEDAKNQILLADGQRLGENILKNLTCLSVVADNVEDHLLSSTNRILENHFIDANHKSGTLYFGINNIGKPEDTVDKDICGKVDIKSEITKEELTQNNSGITITDKQLEIVNREAYQTKKQALSAMINYIKPLAVEIAKLDVEQDSITIPAQFKSKGLLYPAANIYQNLISGLTKQSFLAKLGLGVLDNNADKLIKENMNKAKNLGWFTAGSFYFMLSRGASQHLLSTANQKMQPTKPNLEDASIKKTSPDSLDAVFQPYDEALTFQYTKNLFDIPDGIADPKKIRFTDNPNIHFFWLLGPTGIGPIMIGLVYGLQTAMENFINNVINSHEGDPLLEHAKAGATLMLATEIIFIALAFGAFAVSLILATCSSVSPGGTAVVTALMTIVMPLMAILGILWSLGATLAIYVPLVPYMMFAVTSLGWLMLVVEAIVAAPIVALGLIIPGQEELGHVAPALGIIATLFLKPLLMVMGLIMGAKMFIVMISFVSFGFGESIAILQNETNSGSIFSCVPISVLYVGFILALENKCFGLIYQLPDKILRWIGVSGESTDMGAMQEAKQTYDAHAKKGIEPLHGMASGGAEQMQKTIQDKGQAQGGKSTELGGSESKAEGGDRGSGGTPPGGNKPGSGGGKPPPNSVS